MDTRLYWIWLAQACRPGSRTAINLICAFGNPEKIYRADRKKLSEILGEAEYSCLGRLANKDLSEAQQILNRCSESGIGILTPDDGLYPHSLYQLRDAPVVLYYLGQLPDFRSVCACAVVGTRKMSDYGRKTSYDVGRGLGAAGAVLVSGLALGCDGMAMAGALSTGGVTIGVLGCGIDIVYPPEHKDLMQRVLVNGAVMSEYPPGTPPNGKHFPLRNRIISGLSDAVIVIEGDAASGSLITARHALYQARDLYAVPGKIDEPNAAGPNNLIKNGACAITSALDVLRNYEFLYPHALHVGRAEAELKNPVSAYEAKDVAVRMHVSSDDGKKYYGEGLYGSRQVPVPKNKKPSAGSKKISPKKMIQQFREHDAAQKDKEKKAIAANHVELDMLGETEKKIYAALKPDVPVLADDIPVQGIDMPALLAGLTMLELCGVVECGAGGYYMRRSAEELSFTPPEE